MVCLVGTWKFCGITRDNLVRNFKGSTRNKTLIHHIGISYGKTVSYKNIFHYYQVFGIRLF